MTYIFTTNLTQEQYDGFVKKHPYHNLLQSWNWAKIKSNWEHVYTAVQDETGQIVAAGLLLIKRLPAGFGMGYLPRGPILDYKDGQLLSFYMKNLKEEAKKRKVLFVKMDPAIHINDYASKDKNDQYYPETQLYLENFKQAGCLHQGYPLMIEDSIQPRFQAVVTYKEDLEEALPKHTKRLIKDADKRGVEIVFGQSELVDEFSRLVSLTEERKGVSLRNKEYFSHLMETYPEDGVIFLAKCNLKKLKEDAQEKLQQLEKELENTPEHAKKKMTRINDQIRSTRKSLQEYEEMIAQGMPQSEVAIAGILSIQYGDTCEMLYAGMDERFKQFMPQYKEYVENFRWAFERGCHTASMGGVEGTLDDGLTKFKDNFAPLINEFIGEFDLPVNRLLYRPAKFAYELKKAKMKG